VISPFLSTTSEILWWAAGRYGLGQDRELLCAGLCRYIMFAGRLARVYGIAGSVVFLYTLSEQGGLRRDGTVSGMKTKS
jgi:hypothetical protein